MFVHRCPLRFRPHIPIRTCAAKASTFRPPTPLDEYPSVYESGQVERGWYAHWKENGHFRAESSPSAEKTFSMILPPPNVTGSLHLGHALTVTVQDVLARWHRMNGYGTVWVPGSDHAGIATQSVVERSLMASQGKSRADLGRDAFVKEVWKWKEEKGDRIFKQLERMGASLDWDKTSFTMSKAHSRAVTEAFIRLFDRGLIYRGNYLVNWSCALGSAISDIEVDHVNLFGRKKIAVPGYEKPMEFGNIFDLSYEIEGSGEKLTFSTTRPETLLGDVALAVHPSDERYAHLISNPSRAIHPLVPGRHLAVVADERVDPAFGTGVVKITPAHDKNDFEIGKRQGLQEISVIGTDGRMECPEVENFHGLRRFDARWRVLGAMKELGLFGGKREHAMSIPICSRSGDVIEPLIKPQWFLKTAEMEKRALEAADSGELKFHPPRHRNTWKRWLGENEQDWCISRQLWWGHRIPAYNFGGNAWAAGHDLEEARGKAGAGADLEAGVQDEDVLDTWFSSALLPFANHGWPDKTSDLKAFYPLTLMETGEDIIFFWVARMVVLGMELTGELPFKDVFLHGIICDAHGRKMSKSIGNVVDPLHVIDGRSLEKLEESVREGNASGHISDAELPKSIEGLRKDYPKGIQKCGADALRYGLCSYDVTSQQMNLDLNVIKTASAFGNKIWQATRFLVMAIQRSNGPKGSTIDDSKLRVEDKWILSRCAATISNLESHFRDRDFPAMTRGLRMLIYTNLCDVYLETAKPHLLDCEQEHFTSIVAVLHRVLLTGMKLLHPIMPFLTEELYHRLPLLEGESRKESIMHEPYPSSTEWSNYIDEDLMGAMDDALEIVTSIRAQKSDYSLDSSVRPIVIVKSTVEDSSALNALKPLTDTMVTLCKSGDISLAGQVERLDLEAGSWTKSTACEGRYLVYMNVRGLLDAANELERYKKKRAKLEKEMAKLQKKMLKRIYERESDEVKARDASALETMEGNLRQIAEDEEFMRNYAKNSDNGQKKLI